MNVSSSGGIAIRRAAEADVPLVLSFIRALAEYEKIPGEVAATEEMLRDSLFGPQRAAEAALAYYGDEPAGYAVFFHNFSTNAGRRGMYLEDIFVHEEYRGRGVGKALLKYVIDTARERGCARMNWSVLKWNRPAIEFYESLGARALADWTVFRLDLPSR